VRANFTGAPYSNTWYPIALANRLYGADLEPKTGDIKVTINSGFPDWYFGTDGKPAWNKYDFVSVVFHEIAHGLGFSGSTKVLPDSKAGSWGIGSATLYPLIYDQFVINGSGQKLIDSFPNNSKTLGDQLQSGNLYFKGKYAFAAGGSANPKIYAPPTWQQGSSFSHLDESTYPISSGNSLMTPSLANGEAVQVPGPITLGIFEDIGWAGSATIAPTVTPASPTATPRPAYSHFNFFPAILRSVQRGQ
jgi:hypothetical protein